MYYKTSRTDLDDFITKKQCAQLLKISEPTVDNWRKRGILKSYKIGMRVLFKKDEVLNELNEG